MNDTSTILLKEEVNVLIEYYKILKSSQARLWMQMFSTFNVLMVFAGILTFFLTKESSLILQSIGYIALPNIFSLMYLETMSNIYENTLLIKELLRIERKLNSFYKKKYLLIDSLWFYSHTKLNYIIFNPVFIRGWFFVLIALLFYIIASWWAFNSMPSNLKHIFRLIIGISTLIMISSGLQTLRALNEVFEFGRAGSR